MTLPHFNSTLVRLIAVADSYYPFSDSMHFNSTLVRLIGVSKINS